MRRHIMLFKEIIKYYFERILCIYLKIKRKPDELMCIEDLNNIKSIEASAYPEQMQYYANCLKLDDFVVACDCMSLEQIYYYAKDNWYIVVVKHLGYTKIWNFAARDGKCRNVMEAFAYLFKNFSNDKIKIECRATTSYPLLLSLAKRKRVRILSDRCVAMKDELFHEVTVKAVKKK